MDRVELKRAQILAALETASQTPDEPLLVRNVMTSAPTTVDMSTSVLDLVRLLQKHGFRHLLVVHPEGNLAGVLSDRDVIRCFGPERYPDERRLSKILAADIMSSDILTVHPETQLAVAVDMMIAHGISSLPVVVEEKVLGILTNTDLHLLLQAVISGASVSSPAQAC